MTPIRGMQMHLLMMEKLACSEILSRMACMTDQSLIIDGEHFRGEEPQSVHPLHESAGKKPEIQRMERRSRKSSRIIKRELQAAAIA